MQQAVQGMLLAFFFGSAMAVNKLINVINGLNDVAQSNTSPMRIAIISAYDPANYCAKVLVQPEGVETGWLPVFSPWIGNGWGMFCPPNIGDQVKVHFQEGDFESGVVALRSFNDVDRPLNVPPGEFWLVHQSGSFLKFHNGGNVELVTNANLTATVGGTLNATVAGAATMSAASWAVTGNMVVTGSISASGTISDHLGTMDAMRTIYDSHTHGGVATGGSNTNTPNQTM
jgi:phage baseplate assembly protein V